MHAANDHLLRDAASDGSGEPAVQNPQVRTLLLTDLCDSTLLVERLGDNAAAELFREHDRLVLGLQQRWRGRLIDRSDGLLLLFERAIDGLGFALDYARGLRELGERREVAKHGVELLARQGLHVGEVLTWRNSDAAVSIGAKPLEVEGLAKPMAGRLMTLARPGQILLSATAEPLAHRAARELGERGEQLLWKDWGRWRFKGVPQAQQVYEVGEPGIAPLRAPQQNRAKAWRDIPLWRRPAALAAELVLVAGLVGGAWFLTKPQPAIAFSERDWVVVGDLRNLTGDTLLDDSLEQAFRISLEQSRYVNVLSDLKARDTLGRMRRKPDTVLDRAVASEIALRDGARAVILPTVAEIGGRVRVSAEVIDPHTQTTVYAASADGSGAGSTLGSIDKVTSELRGKLGEALESIQKNSVSLPNVTTSNLDALKSYAIGEATRAAGRRSEAISYYERAIALDPTFALAMLAIAGQKDAIGSLPEAKDYYDRALALRSHLPPREGLFLDAILASRRSPRQELEQWRQVLALYPDTHEALFQLAQDEMFYANRYAAALKYAKSASVLQSPFRARSKYLEGMILLGMDRYGEALQSFGQSRKWGYRGARIAYAYAYAAQRDYLGADAIFSDIPSGMKREAEEFQYQMLTAIGKGRVDQAREAASAGLDSARKSGSLVAEAEWNMLLLSVDTLSGKVDKQVLRDQLRGQIDVVDGRSKLLDDVYPNISRHLMLAAGYLAGSRLDDAEATSRVAAAIPMKAVQDYPVLEQLRIVLDAEIARLKGEPRKCLQILETAGRDEESIIPVHATLLRCALAAREESVIGAQSAWLKAHPGRAYVEEGADTITMPLNVWDTRAEASISSLGR